MYDPPPTYCGLAVRIYGTATDFPSVRFVTPPRKDRPTLVPDCVGDTDVVSHVFIVHDIDDALYVREGLQTTYTMPRFCMHRGDTVHDYEPVVCAERGSPNVCSPNECFFNLRRIA